MSETDTPLKKAQPLMTKDTTAARLWIQQARYQNDGLEGSVALLLAENARLAAELAHTRTEALATSEALDVWLEQKKRLVQTMDGEWIYAVHVDGLADLLIKGKKESMSYMSDRESNVSHDATQA